MRAMKRRPERGASRRAAKLGEIGGVGALGFRSWRAVDGAARSARRLWAQQTSRRVTATERRARGGLRLLDAAAEAAIDAKLSRGASARWRLRAAGDFGTGRAWRLARRSGASASSSPRAMTAT